MEFESFKYQLSNLTTAAMQNPCELLAVGASAGGLGALQEIIGGLFDNFPIPIVVAQHLSPHVSSDMVRILDRWTRLSVQWAATGKLLKPDSVYIAPPNQHLLVTGYNSIRLSSAPRDNFSRPSINVLFESVAASFGPRAIALVLSGANSDGARGAQAIKLQQGIVLAQDEASAECPVMPRATIETGCVDAILPLEFVAPTLKHLVQQRYIQNDEVTLKDYNPYNDRV